MPLIDLSALKTAQTEAARARVALGQAGAAADAARETLRRAEETLHLAEITGDEGAARRAATAVEKAGARLSDHLRKRDALADRQRDVLGDAVLRLGFDAAGDLPLLLMPLRLETRFATVAGRPVLRLRIYPDDIHIETSDPGLTEAEQSAARAYWAALFAAPDDAGIDAAWAALRTAVGRRRARAVALASRPLNPEARGTGAAPVFPDIPAPTRTGARPRLLPERFRVTAWQNGQQLRAEGAAVARDLRVGLLSGDEAGLVDQDGLAMLPGTEWLADYDRALKAGMAIDLPLPSGSARIERLYVYGVCQSRNSADSAAALESLLASHDGAGDLAFLAQDTPTNNSEAADSGWARWLDPAPVPLVPPALPGDADGTVATGALGAGAAVLAAAPGAGMRQQGVAGAMAAALWPATWGFVLDLLDPSSPQIDPAMIDAVRAFQRDHLRGRGALPVLRVGRQPYGLLPFAGFARTKGALTGARTAEAGLTGLVRKVWPNWLNGTTALPRLTKGRGNAQTVLNIMGHAPRSFGVRARRVLSGDLLKRIEGTTAEAKSAAEVEQLLERLLTESLGAMSMVLPGASLDTESRPVALPYADPARDAGVLRALLDGAPTGKVSSVFQALALLGFQRSKAAATVTRRFAEALRATEAINPDLTERVIHLALQDAAAPETYRATLAEMPPSGEAASVARNLAEPVALRPDLADRMLSAGSRIEREGLGVELALGTLRARAAHAELRTAFESLIALAATPEGADLTAAVAETLDGASHRLDMWVLALSSARLARMRQARPEGLSLGAVGWLFDLDPAGLRAKPAGGYVAAPSLEQATTAGLLRSAYLSHNPEGGGSGAFAVDLTSGRVRRALSLAQGIANGQPLAALLGYDFERRLHEAGCGRFVLCFRALAPLVAGRLTETGVDSPAGVAAEANVTDMLRLMARWNDPAEGAAVLLAKLATPPDNDYLDTAHWTGPTAAETAAITAAVAAAAEDQDAVADLMLAESVHQLAQGSMARAAAVMDAAGKGEAPPPTEPEVILTRGPGAVVTHRLIAVTEGAGGRWPATSPRALAAPGIEAWAAARLPDPGQVPLGRDAAGQAVTLADVGLSALDFAAASRHPGLLERLIRARAPLANPEAEFPADAGGGVTLAEAALAGAALQAVLDRARALDGLSIGLPGAAGWKADPAAVRDALSRLNGAAGVLNARLGTLDALMAQVDVRRDDLTAALLALSDFGIVLPEMGTRPVADLAHLALAEGAARLDKLAAITGTAGPQTVAAAAQALFGQGLPMPLRHVFAPDDPAEPLGLSPIPAPGPGAVARFLSDSAVARVAVGDFGRLSLIAGITGDGPSLIVVQMCGHGDHRPDRWIGAGLPADMPSPECPVAAIIADAPDGFDLTQGIAGLVIDEWTETLARRAPEGAEGSPAASRATAGVALHADAPGAEPPQALLLALSPDGERWTEDRLCDWIADLHDLMRVRLISAETLPLAGRLLPAIYTQSWSLQGEPVIDWSKITMDAVQMARIPGLKQFTMTQEG